MSKIFYKSDNLLCKHAFSTRLGGVSKGCYNSLNLGFFYGDSHDDVVSNWKIIAEETCVDISNIVITDQVHGNNVAIVDYDDAFNPLSDKPKCVDSCDGLVTNKKGLTIVIFTADCGCLLLEDTKNNVICALHCGWRSFTQDIIANGLGKMQQLGAHLNWIKAAIGPCIRSCCFETGDDVKLAYDNVLGPDASRCYEKHNDKYLVDIPKGIEIRLVQLGIKPSNISKIEKCTKCNTNEFFSYRAENGKTGRLAHFIVQ